MGSRTLWLWLFVASLGATALLGVLALLTPGIPYEEELLASSALLTGYSLLGLVGTLAIARGPLPVLGWTAIALLALSLCAWLALIWFDSAIYWEVKDTVAKLSVSATSLGVLGLHAVLLLMVRLTRRIGRFVRAGSIVAACAGVLLALSVMWDVPLLLDDEATGRFAAALLIPAALATIAVPVLSRIESVRRREGESEGMERSIPVSLRCPRCAAEVSAAANRKSRCQACSLEITVTITEPRCVCGYPLYGLPSPVCPECGRAAPPEQRWGPPAREEALEG